ncbi:hypothetical protein ACFY4C_20285 [Actinomadura viridis]
MRQRIAKLAAALVVKANDIELGTVRVCATHGKVFAANEACPRCAS